MIFCDVVNCRYNKGRKCCGPQKVKQFNRQDGEHSVHMLMACDDFTQHNSHELF